MREIMGKQIYDSLAEIVTPKHTAVLVVDMQNDFCKPGGHFDHHGYGANLVEAQKMIPRLVRFLDEARKESVFIVFIQNSYLPNGLSESPAYLYNFWKIGLRKEGIDVTFCVEGTWGQEQIAELHPQRNEPVIKKHRASAFHNTCLDLVLKNKGIQSVIVTGAATRACVEKTAIDACFHDYYPVILSDCVSPPDDTLTTVSFYDVASFEDVLKEWASVRRLSL